MKDYNEALDAALALAKYLAPTSEAEAGFSRLVNEMKKEGENPSDITVQLVLALSNGLRYGNWLTEK